MVSQVKLVAQFFLYLLIGFIILKLPVVQPAIESFCMLIAKFIELILSTVDDSVQVSGAIVYRYNFNNAVEIDKACTVLEYITTMTAALMIFPTSLKKRVAALLLAIVIYQSVNTLRIISLLYVQAGFSSDVFDFVHFRLWPFILILFSGLYYIFWALSQNDNLEIKRLNTP